MHTGNLISNKYIYLDTSQDLTLLISILFLISSNLSFPIMALASFLVVSYMIIIKDIYVILYSPSNFKIIYQNIKQASII